MRIESSDSSLYPPLEQGVVHRGRRLLAVLGTSAVAMLGTAGPALADELPTPEPVPGIVPVLPEPVVPDIPPLPAPDLADLPTVVTQIDGANVDVSVRVLSPGLDGTVTQESETPVISPDAAPDITAPEAGTEADAAAVAATTQPAVATNTNVSVRVLSPGDRGDVDQLSAQLPTGGGGGADAGAAASDASGEPQPARAASDDTTKDSSQYQGDNSLEEYAPDLTDDPWHWAWFLSIDCSGNAISSSTESGSPGSLAWSWDWSWEWGCADPPAHESEPRSSGGSAPPAAAPERRPLDEPPPAAATAEPWTWTWTFTFCGETRTISTQAGAGTPLTWTWDWSWRWSCGGTGTTSTAPPAGIDVPRPLAVLPPAEDDASRFLQDASEPELPILPAWLATAPPESEPAGTTEVVIVMPSLVIPVVEPAVEVVIPAVVLPIPTAPSLAAPAFPFPPEAAAAGPTTPRAVSAPRRHTRTPAPTSIAVTPLEIAPSLPQPEPRAQHARPAKHPRAQSSPPRARIPLPPFFPQPHQAGGSSSAGGIVPSALLFGVAALTGFIILAAPGVGRRIRVARELSPRSLDQSPIDHPG